MIHKELFKYIDMYFYNLNIRQKNILKSYSEKLITELFKRFYINTDFLIQFHENKGRDYISLILILLPFFNIENPNDLKKITDLNILIKDNKTWNTRVIDFVSDYQDIEEYLEKNFIMLCKSIKICSNKLYINWITTKPLLITEYKEKDIFKDTENFLKGERDESGLYEGDLFHTIAFDLFYNVKKVKWLLYEKIVDGKPKSYEEFINELYFSNNNKEIQFQKSLYTTDSFDVLKYALIFFENYYSIDKKGYRKFKDYFKDIEDEEAEDIVFDINEIQREDVIAKLHEIGYELWYAYLDDVKRIFNYSWYSKRSHIIKNENGYFLTRKNIYHFAKNIYHKSDRNDYTQLCYHWEELDDASKNSVLLKLKNRTRIDRWFKISSYLEKTYGDVDINAYTKFITDNIYNFLPELIFESLIYKGVLSEYKPSNKLDLDVKKYMESYYYLTGNKFDENYLTNLKNFNWFTTYALDWISQINFFHKVFHSRINYITGSTGVGKSTQAPKLLLYSMRMIYYRNSTSVLCSQPRTAPTENNAKRVAVELGVPLDKSSNYYMQFQHQKKKHVPSAKEMIDNVKNENMVYWTTFSLKILTDGTLYSVLKKNLTLMQQKSPLIKNEHDVIIVDEAHEHNYNMDLILSLMKHVMQINFSVKLAIISATMEDDEPRYRNFYKSILDDHQIPLIENFDRKFLDRRIHISPFGQTTRFTIEEKDLKENPINYKESEKLGFSKVLDIAKNTLIGDILFFSVGQGPIDKIVEELNKTLPFNMIAFPYYAQLPSTFKDIFEKLDKNLKMWIYDRENIMEILRKHGENWNLPTLQYRKVTTPYTRVVIVSTTIAEASITIDSLKYVVDTGYTKTNIFNVKTGTTDLETFEITQSSRNQRKGRVGRTSSGIVYYMYKKESRDEVKPKYSICNTNMIGALLELSCNENYSEIKKKYRDLYQNYRKIFFEKFPNIDLDLDMLLDYNGIFHIVHPDEDIIERNRNTGIINVSSNKFKLKYIYDRISKNKYLKEVINKSKLQEIIKVKEKILHEQLDVFDIICLLIAYNFDKDTFFRVAYFLFSIKLYDGIIPDNIMNVHFKRYSLDEIEFMVYEKNIEKTIYLAYIIIEQNKIYLPSIAIPLSEKEKIGVSLSFQNLLNIAYFKEGEWYNIHSKEKVPVTKEVDYMYIYYYQKNIFTKSLEGIFPLNSNFISLVNY